MLRCDRRKASAEGSPIKVGNVVGGGKAQGGSVYLVNGISPSLLAGMSHGNVMPFIVEVNDGKV